MARQGCDAAGRDGTGIVRGVDDREQRCSGHSSIPCDTGSGLMEVAAVTRRGSAVSPDSGQLCQTGRCPQ